MKDIVLDNCIPKEEPFQWSESSPPVFWSQRFAIISCGTSGLSRAASKGGLLLDLRKVAATHLCSQELADSNSY
jgi:hypothetical protein